MGCSLVLMEGAPDSPADRLWRLIEEERVNILGCSPTLKKEVGAASDMGADWPGGYYCPCHNSRFDLSARVFKGSPAPKNLVIPPHHYTTDTVVVIGEDKKA